jgi:Putative metallopeptidase
MMKRLIHAAVVVLAAAAPATCATRAMAQAPAELQNPQIEIVYAQPRAPGLRPVFDRLKARGVLEELRQFLAPLRLPRKLTVRMDQCGAATRPYQPQGPVTICYELVDQIERIAAKIDADTRPSAIAGAFIVVVLHELAHGLLDVLQVPVWGRRGDAADRLAALVMLQFGDDLALRTLVGATVFFTASNKTWTGSAFADVNSPEQQRYYNYLCIAYGGAPIAFKMLVTPDERGQQALPAARARRCQGEYDQVLKVFNQWVMPSVDPVLLVKVRATPWLRPSDVTK